MPYAVHSVVLYDRTNRRALSTLASGLTMHAASTLAASLRDGDRANEARVGYRIETAPLVEQAAVLRTTRAPRPTRTPAARLAAVVRSCVMNEAHTVARTDSRALPYAVRLGDALRAVYARPRRCPLSLLRRQAAEFVRVAMDARARFDVVGKACDALRLSIASDVRSLCLPSKLVGVASYQDAARAVSDRIETRGGWLVCEMDGRTAFGLGLRLGDVQPKHAGWIAALTADNYPVRVAVTMVTGGRTIETADGRTIRTTRGVNVALEVGKALGVTMQRRESERVQAAIRAGALVPVGPGMFVPPSRAAAVLADVQRAGGHSVAWGRLD